MSRYLLAAIFIIAGVAHLLTPGTFVPIVPPQLPSPNLLVLISGLAEILGGIGILVPLSRRFSGWGLIALLIAVFPANVYMAQQHIVPAGTHLPDGALWARLPLQPLLIWWVYTATLRAKK